MREDQAAAERAVFAEFARVSGLPILLDSVDSRDPPEPDILCDVEGEGPVAFELGEIVNESFEQVTGDGATIDARFRTLWDNLPSHDRDAVENCLGGPPAVLVGFREGVPTGKWRHVVPAIVGLLVAQAKASEGLHAGEFDVWRTPGLRDLITDMIIRPASSGRPCLLDLEMVEIENRTQRLLASKFKKAYESDAPKELLAYFSSEPPPDEPEWMTETLAFIRDWIGLSAFRRVWVFNARISLGASSPDSSRGPEVLLAYPDSPASTTSLPVTT